MNAEYQQSPLKLIPVGYKLVENNSSALFESPWFSLLMKWPEHWPFNAAEQWFAFHWSKMHPESNLLKPEALHLC